MITLHKTVKYLDINLSQEQLSRLGHILVAMAKEKNITYTKVEETQGSRTYKVNAYPDEMRDDVQNAIKAFAQEHGIRIKRKRKRITKIERV